MANKKELETGAQTIKKAKKNNKEYVHEVEIKIDGDAWKKALDEVFKKKQKDAKVDGFRKGKVPKDVFFKHFGKESLYLEAADTVLQDAYDKAMEESKLLPIVRPSVNLNDINDEFVEFTFKIITKPEVKVKKYKDIKIEKEDVKVTKEEIDHEVEHLLEHYAELATKEDGKVENGNIAIIDFEGFKDGKAFEGGKGENYSLEIGSNTFIPGFEDGVIGMKVGEEKDLNLTFPEDYGAPDLAGKEVVFKVKVNEIKEKQKRELDKEFFEDLAMDGVDSKESLEKSIKETIKARKDADAENKYVDDLLGKVAENTEVEIPEEMIDEEVHRLIHRFEEQLRMQGISLDLYYEFTKTTHEDMHKQMEGEARKNVTYRLILEELVKLEHVEVTLEDGEAEADKLAVKYNMKKEDLLKEFGGLEMIMYDLEVRKVFDKLKEYNK